MARSRAGARQRERKRLTAISFPATQLVQTVLDQAHLAPLPLTVRPVLWDYDHALRLYPMPTTVSVPSPPPNRHLEGPTRCTDLSAPLVAQLVLADSFEPYKLVYERCLVFNPGSFNRRRFGWSTYHPHMTEIKDRMEERCVRPSSVTAGGFLRETFRARALLTCCVRAVNCPIRARGDPGSSPQS